MSTPSPIVRFDGDSLECLRADLVAMQRQLGLMLAQIDRMSVQPNLVVHDFRRITGPSLDEIACAIARILDVPVAEIINRGRSAHVAESRQIAYFFCRAITGLPLKKIGDHFNGRDHGTIIFGLQAVTNKWALEPKFRARHQSIAETLCQRFNLVPSEQSQEWPDLTVRYTALQ